MNACTPLALVLALGSGCVHAQVAAAGQSVPAPAPAAVTSSAPASAAAPAAQGWLISKDPATGQWRMPTADELRELNARAAIEARSAPAPQSAEVTLPNGSKAVRLKLDATFDATMVAGKAADGSVTMDCLPGADAAAKVMAPGVRGTTGARMRPAGEPLDER